MKIGKVLIASIALLVIQSVFGMLTCGWMFNWVYRLEPTNVWKAMDGPPGLGFWIGQFVMTVVFVAVYVLLSNGIPGKSRAAKGMAYGLCVWAVGMLPGMLATYFFMTVNPGVIVYWTIQALIVTPVMGMAAALICGENPSDT